MTMDNSRVDNLLDLAASQRPTSFLPFVEITQVLVTSSCLKRAQEELCKEHGLNAAGSPGETSVWVTFFCGAGIVDISKTQLNFGFFC